MSNRYLSCTSNLLGAVAVFHLYGEESALAERIDGRVGRQDGGRGGQTRSNGLQDNALRYGLLRRAGGQVVDEVLLGKVRPGARVLMTHGGSAIRDAVTAWLEEEEFSQTFFTEEVAFSSGQADPLLVPMLTNCVTETEVAGVLSLLAGGEGSPPRLRRVLLCGAPNVGKSSLFNRLCDWERSFVHDGSGATADTVEETIDLAGYGVRLADTPGFAPGTAAWKAARRRLGTADWLLFVCDGSAGWREEDAAAARALCEAGVAGAVRLLTVNKADLGCVITGEPWREFFPAARTVTLSSLPGSSARRIIETAAYRAESEDTTETAKTAETGSAG